jgi:acyl-CoA thioesterase-1
MSRTSSMTRHTMPVTLALLCLAVILAACGPEAAPPPPAPAASDPVRGTILCLGDSLTAGYGLPESEAFPALLEQRLQAEGLSYRVINAGISGETSSGALSRLDWVLTLNPDIVILATGANDGLRGVDPDLTRRNLEAMAVRLNSQGRVVVLAGMQMVRNLGLPFTRAFEANYPAVAEAHGLILIPFLLEGVAGRPELNLADGIHPNREGHRRVAELIHPFVREAIRRHAQNLGHNSD